MQFQFNSDKEYVHEVLEALKKNNGYCPCQLGRTPDTKCMCKIFRKQTKIGEECPCGLYVKTDG